MFLYPTICIASIKEFTTLEWSRSPTMAMFKFSNFSFDSWIVIKSINVWVGCETEPSPALINCIFEKCLTRS